MEVSKTFAKNILRSRGLKQTSTRVALISNIHNYAAAMPYTALQKSLEADRTTIYRTLNTLMDECIIHKAKEKDNETYYAVCGNECTSHKHSHNHIHFQCTVCKKVTCETLINEIQLELAKHHIESVEINVNGVCDECR